MIDRFEQQTEEDTASLERRLALARDRAGAVEQWRADVEARALVDRQRAQAMEQDAARINRLKYHIADLNRVLGERDTQIVRLEQELEQLLKPRSLYRELRWRLRRTAPGEWLHRLRQSCYQVFGRGLGEDMSSDAPVEQGADADGSAAVLQDGRAVVLVITAGAQDRQQGQALRKLIEALSCHVHVALWELCKEPLFTIATDAVDFHWLDGLSQHDYDHAHEMLGRIVETTGRLDDALLLGTDCRSALPALAARYIPSLTVVTDDEIFRHDIYFWQELLYWSTHTLLPSRIAQEQLLSICLYLNPKAISVRGRCNGAAEDEEAVPASTSVSMQAAWQRAFAGSKGAHPAVTVLGWGAPDFASGLDSFVACAARLRRQVASLRFIWLTQAQTQEADASFPFHVRRMIARQGLEDVVVLLDAPVPLSLALPMVDLVCFPARTDVRQGAMAAALQAGIPVIGFAEATQTARVMAQQGFSEACLAPPDDTDALAERLHQWITDVEARTALGDRLAAGDWSALAPNGYAEALLERFAASRRLIAQERRDEDTLLAADALMPDYMGEIVHRKEAARFSDARLYVRGWHAGVGARKPRPGFHPARYAAGQPEHQRQLEEPFAAWLRAGRPDGPWCRNTICLPAPAPADVGADADTAAPPAGSVALHIHAFYPAMVAEILERIAVNRCRPDLFISVPDAAAATAVRVLLEDYEGRLVALEPVPNAGRDIGPFLTAFGARMLQDYALIGHMHTKHSGHADRQVVDLWRNLLLESLLGGALAGPAMDVILAEMQANPSWGIVFPDDPLPLGWDGNRESAQVLASAMGMTTLPEHPSFPAGTMFWMRAQALRPFVDLGLDYADYPREPLPVDGTLLHALERLFGVVPEAQGMEAVTVSVRGVSR